MKLKLQKRIYPGRKLGLEYRQLTRSFELGLWFYAVILYLYWPDDDRYQNQSRLVRCYRWLRYKPYGFVRNIAICAYWAIFSRVPIFGDRPAFWSDLKLLWEINCSWADIEMNWMYSLDEVYDELEEER